MKYFVQYVSSSFTPQLSVGYLEFINPSVHSELYIVKFFFNRKFFLDALPMMGNEASLKMMTRLISNKDVTGMEADMWLTTLSFIKDPTKDMLNDVKVGVK